MLRSLTNFLRPRSPAEWHALLVLAFAAVLAVEMFGLHALDTTEYRLSDMFMVRHAASHRADPGIVIVDIDDASMSTMHGIAGLWSWPREIHADLLAGLSAFGPRAVVMDVAFSERDIRRPKSDARLSEEVAAMPRAYLAAIRLLPQHDASGVPLQQVARAFGVTHAGPTGAVAAVQLPLAIAPAGWRLGLVNSIEDGDGVLRRYRLYSKVQGWQLPSLPARVMKDLGAVLPAGEDFVIRWPAVGHKRYAYGDLYRVLTEQRPRQQSRVMIVPLAKGDGVVFAVNNRPVKGVRGDYQVKMRHGVSRLTAGQRHTLGIIFHDAS